MTIAESVLSTGPGQADWGLAPWWQARHVEEQRGQFFRLLEKIPRSQAHEIADMLHFLLWRQEWGSGRRRLPGWQELLGGAVTLWWSLRSIAAGRAGIPMA